MTARSAIHSTFVIERTYDAAPARVFAAWAEPAAKARWAACHAHHEMDFRIGGREVSSGGEAGGPVYTTEIWYRDIEPGERIVYTYTLSVDGTRVSVSLVTVEIVPLSGGARLTYTEQGVYLDGHDTPEQRERGTREGFARLDEEVQAPRVAELRA